jgi:Protein of unknown function (DUF3043)
VRFLRRNPEPAKPETPAQDGAIPTVGKGRPTPKRREAEARRRGPVAPPPRTQREALKRIRGSKEERRVNRAERRERMMAGEDKYLLPRDRGPVRAYVRDLVDSRRQMMGLFMPLALLVLLTLFLPSPAVQSAVSLLTLAMFAVILVETLFLGRYVNKMVRQKFPDAKDRGASLTFYAFSRATMLRRMRSPRPRVGYGELP